MSKINIIDTNLSKINIIDKNNFYVNTKIIIININNHFIKSYFLQYLFLFIYNILIIFISTL
jgi:hypothetical protein